MHAAAALLLILVLALPQAAWSLSHRAEACVAHASYTYQVNRDVLRAILMTESGGNRLAIRRNKNGTVDVGLAQINEVHFKELRQYGILPQHLFDECVAAHVAAWHYAKQVRQFGHTWQAIGAYHSRTPHHNQRYQRKVYEKLKRLPPAPASPLRMSHRMAAQPAPATTTEQAPAYQSAETQAKRQALEASQAQMQRLIAATQGTTSNQSE